MAQKPKPKPKPAKPPMPPEFDFSVAPVPDNPSWELGQQDYASTPLETPYTKKQRYLPPSKRDNPVLDYCKGGKVIKSHGR
jgi:hypothetical protein